MKGIGAMGWVRRAVGDPLLTTAAWVSRLRSRAWRAGLWDSWGRRLVRRRLPRLSLCFYRRATALDGENARIWRHQAAAAMRAGDLHQAARCYRRLARLDADNPRAHCRLAAIYEVVGAPDAGAEVCRSALARMPHASCLHRNYGRLLFYTGGVHSALRALQRAAELSPEHGDTHYFIGLMLRRMGRDGEARRALRRALALRPDDPKLYYALGLCCGPDDSADKSVPLLLEGLAAEELAAGLEPPTWMSPAG
jgi:tetratricopeptide (TPR) repeat protein